MGAKHMPRGAVTKARNLQLYIEGPVKEWMDIQNQHMHKGVGIKFLQDTYQIKSEECAAFGDQMNDYEMLQEVKYAYAMSNAVQPIKDIAYEVIGSNDEQAVLKKIEDILNG